MRRIFPLLLVLSAIALHSCSTYGKKVKINDSLEIYYKGDGVTETDARKMGDFLADLWKDYPNLKSMQLLKNGDGFEVKMVVDEKMVKEEPGLESSFIAVKSLLETEVFKDKKIKFTITDNTFKDIKSY